MSVTRKSRNGFTLVELLIVIVVIAILAAIVIVAFGNVTNKANDSAVQSDLSQIQRQMEMVNVTNGAYPQSSTQLPTGFKLSKSSYDTTQNNAYLIVDTVNNHYAFGARSKSGDGFILTDGGIQAVRTVNGAATASAIGVTWGATGTAVWQGYTSGVGWAATFPWTS